MKLTQSFLIFLSIAGIAHAETNPLGPILVEEPRDKPVSKTAPTVEESRKELAKIPGGSEVVEADRYLRGRASTMADTFALSPGVVAQPRFGSDEARISIRGSGMQRTFHGRGIRLLQDGVPLNLADGGFDMQSVDALAADHINILRGSNALTLGSSTLGGAIDYISATGLTAPGGSIRLEVGSFDYLRARVAAGLNQGNVDAYFSLSESFQSGFRDHAEQNNQRLFTNFGWQISDNAETRLYTTAVNSESQLPGSLTKNELNDDPTQADESLFGSRKYDNRRDFQLYRIADKTTFKNGDNTYEIIAAFTYKDLDHPITPFVGVVDQVSQDTLLGFTFTNESTLFGRDHRARAGVFFTHGETNAALFNNKLGERGEITADADQTATNIEGFIENQLALGNGFTGVLGATAAYNRRKNEVILSQAESYTRDYENISQKIGLRWDAENFQVYTNFSNSYEPPSFSETNGALTPNDAQTANTFELGTRGTYANMRWDATVYASQIQGEYLALTAADGTPLGTTNADETIHQGVEIFGEADLLGHSWDATPEHRLLLRGAWTYGHFKFDGDAVYGDNTIAGLPPHLIRGELIWKHQDGYYAGPTLEWVPTGSYIDHANILKANSYGLLGFKIGRRVEKGISWFIETKNLTNERYAATTGITANASIAPTGTPPGTSPNAYSRNFLSGDGRSVFAGIEWKW